MAQAEAIKEAELISLEESRIGLTSEKRLLESAKLNVRRGKIAKRASRFQALGSAVGLGVGLAGKRSAKIGRLLALPNTSRASTRSGATDLPQVGGNIA